MANYWAIAIGINQYQLFQPLLCAKADAEALKEFLVEQAGFVPQRSLLMTDTSPPIGDRSTYPTKDNILLLVEDLAAACWQPQDYLWLFFSGYGVNYEGRDYLMPVDADPKQVAQTGIELRSLMQSLQLANLNVLLLLDINRAVGTIDDIPLGKETLELAKELQLATILSCEPAQFSQESRELGHGLFTAALLAALRSGYGSNLEDLQKHLSIITPELSQHYWRPTQNPVVVLPATPPAMLPPVVTTTNTETIPSTAAPQATIPTTLVPSAAEAIIFPDENFAVALTSAPISVHNSQLISSWEAAQSVETTIKDKSQSLSLPDFPLNSNSDTITPASEVTQPSLPIPPEPETSSRFIPNAPPPYISRLPENQTDTSIWKQFLVWGGGTMLVVALISVLLLRNHARMLQQAQRPSSTLPDAGDVQELKTPSNPNAVTKVSSTNQSTAQIVKMSEAQKRNQALLDSAQKSLRQTQASDLKLAITKAQNIKPGEPLYEQAQEKIQHWSRMILDLAEGRAKQRQYNDAIAAAQLIPNDTAIYSQAQAAITHWRLEAKQYLANITLLNAAKGLIQPGQASSYNRAIEVAKKVPPSQPGYDLAQTSITKWSNEILNLAKRRAEQGQYQLAIETATLVPAVTAVYEDAQEAIQKWQNSQ
ncbi:caspase family protein [Anabaena sp. CA = ATCC 33047]|uniref:caspase family protein n=1 Tax=Anabaena sp. (strain CA / ATCC 33047) TaxID=52271 RepID=UPI00083389C7|nr:caspase family protein [Anabaena sp. CA = ATCC 33047]